MIRTVNSVVFLTFCLGLPSEARDTAPTRPAPSIATKPTAKDNAGRSTSSSAAAKEQKPATSKAIASNSSATAPSQASKKLSTSYSSSTTTITYSDEDASPAPVSIHPRADQRLARVTAYWAGEGDYYTGRCISATGIRLHDGHCAVDPSIIPYGSVVQIAGVGQFLAVDTGSAVVARQAAREGGHTAKERSALVIDLFFEKRREGEKFAAASAKFVSISWWTPSSTNSEAKQARSLFVQEDWSKIQSKQL